MRPFYQIFITSQPSRGREGDYNSEPNAVLPVSLGMMKQNWGDFMLTRNKRLLSVHPIEYGNFVTCDNIFFSCG